MAFLLLSPILNFSKQGFGLFSTQRLAWIMADSRGMYNEFPVIVTLNLVRSGPDPGLGFKPMPLSSHSRQKTGFCLRFDPF